LLVAKRLYLNNEVEPATFRQSRNNPLERTFPKGRPRNSEKIKNDENPWAPVDLQRSEPVTLQLC